MSELLDIIESAQKEYEDKVRRERIAALPRWRKIVDSEYWPTSALAVWVGGVLLITIVDALIGHYGFVSICQGWVLASDGEKLMKRFSVRS